MDARKAEKAARKVLDPLRAGRRGWPTTDTEWLYLDVQARELVKALDARAAALNMTPEDVRVELLKRQGLA